MLPDGAFRSPERPENGLVDQAAGPFVLQVQALGDHHLIGDVSGRHWARRFAQKVEDEPEALTLCEPGVSFGRPFVRNRLRVRLAEQPQHRVDMAKIGAMLSDEPLHVGDHAGQLGALGLKSAYDEGVSHNACLSMPTSGRIRQRQC